LAKAAFQIRRIDDEGGVINCEAWWRSQVLEFFRTAPHLLGSRRVQVRTGERQWNQGYTLRMKPPDLRGLRRGKQGRRDWRCGHLRSGGAATKCFVPIKTPPNTRFCMLPKT
jgi:hypothetical protein